MSEKGLLNGILSVRIIEEKYAYNDTQRSKAEGIKKEKSKEIILQSDFDFNYELKIV